MAKKTEAKAEYQYPEIDPRKCLGDNALTCSDMKKLLGWESESDYTARILRENPRAKEATVKYGTDYLLVDEAGEKVRCRNNNGNRPFTESHARKLAQDILNRNWADSRNGEDRTVNGETICISRNGDVVSGQHRGVGFILACQMWAGLNPEKDHSEHWKKLWPEEPTLEAILVYGVSDSPEVLRTLDNVRERSLSDVLFTDPDVFGKVKQADRKVLTRMLDHAVRFVWNRTGVKDAYNPYVTHSTSLGFLARHERLKRCVKHIWEGNQPQKPENGSGTETYLPISRYIPPGTAAGLMYLMASGTSSVDAYHKADPRTEKKLKWDLWDKAEEFWNLLAGTAKEFKDVRFAFVREDGTKRTRKERIAVLVKSWLRFADGKSLSEKEVSLAPSDFAPNRRGVLELVKNYTVGGIDLGDYRDEEESTEEKVEGNGGPESEDPDPEELQRRAEEVRLETQQKEEQKARDRRERKEKLRAEILAAKARKRAEEGDGQEPPEGRSGWSEGSERQEVGVEKGDATE